MITLSRLYLRHWNRWHEALFSFINGTTLIIGPNASGKSSLLDALQVLITGDLRSVRYNTSRERKSGRTLDSYVRGKVKDGHFLRPDDTVGMLAMEIYDHTLATYTTIGMCIEADAGGRRPEWTRFIIRDRLDRDLLSDEDGDPITRSVLRERLSQLKIAEAYDNPTQYQTDLRQALGQLNARFAGTFTRAMAHSSMSNTTVADFVNEMILAPQEIELQQLVEAQEKATSLGQAIEYTQRRIAELTAITHHQSEARQHRQTIERQGMSIAMLEEALVRYELDEYLAAIETDEPQLAEYGERLEVLAKQIPEVDAERDRVRQMLREDTVLERSQRLRKSIEDYDKEITHILRHRKQVFADARERARLLHALLPEHASVEHLVEGLRILQDNHNASALIAGLQEAREAITSERDTLLEERGGKTVERQQATTELERAQRELADLEAGRQPGAPEAAEAFRDALSERLGQRVPFLYEVLAIPDEDQQDLVEAALGRARLALLPPPERLAEAEQLLAGWPRNHDASIVLANTQAAASQHLGGTLAEHVHADHPVALAYARAFLERFPHVATLDEARERGAGVTTDLLIYEHVTTMNPLEGHHPWMIGDRAQHRRIEALRAVTVALTERFDVLSRDIDALNDRIRQFDFSDALVALEHRAQQPVDENEARLERQQKQDELDKLDLSQAEAWQASLEELTAQRTNLTQEQGVLNQEVGRLREALKQARANAKRTQKAWQQKRDTTAALEARFPELVRHARNAIPADAEDPPSIEDSINGFISNRRGMNTRAESEEGAFKEKAGAYNGRHQFEGRIDLDKDDFIEHLTELQGDRLQEYEEGIREYAAKIGDILHADVLYRLFESFGKAHADVRRINDALREVEFGGSKFQFRMTPNPARKPQYDLVQTVGGAPRTNTPLFESTVYLEHKAEINTLIENLVRSPQTDAETQRQNDLLDYRSYFSFDIEETDMYGNKSSIAHTISTGSGGEDQIAFYVTIAAAMMQLYRTHDTRNNHTFRALALDEMGNKLDGNRTANLVEFFRNSGLQVILVQPNDQKQVLKDVAARIYMVWNDRHGLAHIKEVDNIDQIDTLSQAA